VSEEMTELNRWLTVIRSMPSGVVGLKATVDDLTDGYRLRAHMSVNGTMYVASLVVSHHATVAMNAAEMRSRLAHLAGEVVTGYKLGLAQP